MTIIPDYYETLGVLPTSEDVVIRGAYRGLIQKYHPDTYSGDPSEAAVKAREINEAYTLLRDPQKRATYDATRAALGEELPVDDRHATAGPAANRQASAYHPATIDRAAVRSAVFRARHVLITAGYLAAVLLIGLTVRAVLNTNRTDALSYQPAAQQSVASTKPVPIKTTTMLVQKRAVSPIASNQRHASERDKLSLAPALKTEPAKTPIPVPSTELAAKSSSRPPASVPVVETGKARAETSPVITRTPPWAKVKTARRLPRRHHAAITHSAPQQGPSDEEQTRWLNDRSAVSRPRWHLPHGH